MEIIIEFGFRPGKQASMTLDTQLTNADVLKIGEAVRTAKVEGYQVQEVLLGVELYSFIAAKRLNPGSERVQMRLVELGPITMDGYICRPVHWIDRKAFTLVFAPQDELRVWDQQQ